MKIEFGINPNCSETVYRFKKIYMEKIPRTILEEGWYEPTDDYSQMRPNRDEVCIYFYQTGGYKLLEALEYAQIPYDTQQFMADPEDYPQWKPLAMRPGEKELGDYGGSGGFYRRKKYGSSKRNKSKL
jgi:hypothetical protein